jgi:hypothetical protein
MSISLISTTRKLLDEIGIFDYLNPNDLGL